MSTRQGELKERKKLPKKKGQIFFLTPKIEKIKLSEVQNKNI